MKPSFALTLSFEGIDLLHRATDGWRAVGSVAFDTADLGDALSTLREQALSLSPDGVTSKLILPEDQIKYLSIPVNGASFKDLEDLAMKSVDGATPYNLSELAVDWRQNGDQLEVAAVARETLAEAEAFAHEHQFNPVSFVAQPEGSFPGEPFFGGTHAATELFGGPVKPDEDAVAVIGPAQLPIPAAPPLPEVLAEAEAITAAEPTAVPEPISAPQIETIASDPGDVPATPPEAPEAPAIVAAEAPADYSTMAETIEDELSPAIPLTPEELELIEAAEKRGNVEDAGGAIPPAPPELADVPDLPPVDQLMPAPAPKPEPEPEPKAQPTPAELPAEPTLPPMFGSKRAGPADPAPAAPIAPAAPAVNAGAGDAPKQAELSFSSVRRRNGAPELGATTETATGNAAPKLDGATRKSLDLEGVRKLTLRPDKAAAPKTPPDQPAAPVAGVNAPDVPPVAGAPDPVDMTADVPRTQTEASMLSAASSLAPLDDAGLADDANLDQGPDHNDAPPAFVAAKTKSGRAGRKAKRQQDASAEKQRMTVFGARPKADEVVVGGKPKFLGLILTALLLLFLVAMAAFASLGEEGLAGLFRSNPVTTADVLDQTPDPADPAGPAEGEDLASLETVTDPVAEALAEAPSLDSYLNPDLNSDLNAAANGTLTQDLALPEVDGTAVEAAPDSAEIASLAPELQFEPEAPAEALQSPEVFDDAELAPEPEVITPTPNEADTVSTAERYASSGIWQDAPDQPSSPDTNRIDDFYIASIDPQVPSFDAVALPDAGLVQSDTTPPTQSLPAAAGTEFNFDQRGLVTATVDGALTPDGILVYKGRPAVRPSNLPTRVISTPDTGISSEELQRRAKIRPQARPEDLIESNERSVLGGRTRTELAGLRPKSRPSLEELNALSNGGNRLALLNSATSPLVDLNGSTADAIDAAVGEAVAASVLKPRARPSNLDTNASGSIQTAAAATVQPQLPSSASVARQATVKNQLNLKKVNLIGVYGQPSSRRALVRLSSGRFKKVGVGDRIDGGRVAAISESELSYTKSGRTITLKMPRG